MKIFTHVGMLQAEKRIEELQHERGEQDRRHNEEIRRLQDQHHREVAALKDTIAMLKNLNERLLVLSGVEPLADPTSEIVVKEEKPQPPRPMTPTAAIIQRDRERTYARRDGMTHEQWTDHLEQLARNGNHQAPTET